MASWVPATLLKLEQPVGSRNRPVEGSSDSEAARTGPFPSTMPRSRRGAAGANRRRRGPSVIRVLVADDDRAYAGALALLLEMDEEIEVVGRAHDGRHAIALASELDPDVILMDVDMPHVDGFEATREIAATSPVEIIMLSSEDSPHATRLARRLGASEFLHKAIDPFALIAYVHQAAARRQRRRRLASRLS